MPQILTTTSTPEGYVIATMQAQVDAMVTNMAAGKPILAADIAQLVSTYNDFVAHYHTVSDLRGINTFGNLSVYGAGLYVTSTSTTPSGFAGDVVPAGVYVNGEVTAADINTIIAFVNSMRTHTHTINDITS